MSSIVPSDMVALHQFSFSTPDLRAYLTCHSSFSSNNQGPTPDHIAAHNLDVAHRNDAEIEAAEFATRPDPAAVQASSIAATKRC
jgi:hypothetical protein